MRVFLDTEFTDFIDCRLISVGMVTEAGDEFYGEVARSVWDGHQSEFVNNVIVPQLNGPAYPELELSARLYTWLNELPLPAIQVVIDTQTDWDLLVDLLDDGPPKMAANPTFLNVELLVESEIHAAKYQITTKEKVRRQLDAELRYRTEFARYFSNTQQRQHHALHDARAMRHAFAEAYGVIYRGLYRSLQL